MRRLNMPMRRSAGLGRFSVVSTPLPIRCLAIADVNELRGSRYGANATLPPPGSPDGGNFAFRRHHVSSTSLLPRQFADKRLQQARFQQRHKRHQKRYADDSKENPVERLLTDSRGLREATGEGGRSQKDRRCKYNRSKSHYTLHLFSPALTWPQPPYEQHNFPA
jgi:hypothetical protein